MPAVALVGAVASVAAGASAIAAAGGIAAMGIGSALVAGAQIAGGVLTAVGTVTKNQKLAKVGAIIGIAGVAAGAISGQFNGLLGGAESVSSVESAPVLTGGPRFDVPVGDPWGVVSDVGPKLTGLDTTLAPSIQLPPSQQFDNPMTTLGRPAIDVATPVSRPMAPAAPQASVAPQVATTDTGLLTKFAQTIKNNPELVKLGTGALAGMANSYGNVTVEERRAKAQQEAIDRYNRSIINQKYYR